MIIGKPQPKPKDEFGKLIPEPSLCLECSTKLLGYEPSGLTWFADKCFGCGGYGRICTTRSVILKLDSKKLTS